MNPMVAQISKDSPVFRLGPTNGPQMAMVHGLGTNHSFWLPVGERLAADHGMLLFDLAGSGGAVSAHCPRRHGSLEGYAEDLVDLCLSLDMRDIHLVGHSAGGIIGLLASLQRPDLFSSLCLICPSPCYLNLPGYQGGLDHSDVDGYLEMMEQNFMGWAVPFTEAAAKDAKVAQRLAESFSSADHATLRHFARVIFLSDYRQVLNLVTHPCLIIQPSNDDIVPVSVGEFMHSQIPGSRLEIIDVAGHCPHLTRPDEIQSLLRQHLTLC